MCFPPPCSVRSSGLPGSRNVVSLCGWPTVPEETWARRGPASAKHATAIERNPRIMAHLLADALMPVVRKHGGLLLVRLRSRLQFVSAGEVRVGEWLRHFQ